MFGQEIKWGKNLTNTFPLYEIHHEGSGKLVKTENIVGENPEETFF